MAWRSSGASNRELVENLWRNKLITRPEVKEAFLKVDRAHYAPSFPYDDSPQPIGHGATISAPHMHASAVEHLLPFLLPSPARPAPRVLDVGSGSGYLTAVMAELAGDRGLVVGLEHIPALRDLAERNLARSDRGRALLRAGRVRFRVGDGRRGWVEPREDGGAGADEDAARWDAIHVGAAAAEVHPALLDQLRAPGACSSPSTTTPPAGASTSGVRSRYLNEICDIKSSCTRSGSCWFSATKRMLTVILTLTLRSATSPANTYVPGQRDAGAHPRCPGVTHRRHRVEIVEADAVQRHCLGWNSSFIHCIFVMTNTPMVRRR
ncbi:hypothetical protein VTH06DRAFT_5881 [Thermothelomyces fergusii]